MIKYACEVQNKEVLDAWEDAIEVLRLSTAEFVFDLHEMGKDEDYDPDATNNSAYEAERSGRDFVLALSKM